MDRRAFLKVSGSAAAGLALGWQWQDAGAAADADPRRAAVAAHLAIRPDGTVVVQVPKAEMGQGVTTSIPMLFAEELDVPMSRVRFELAPGAAVYRHPRLGQVTGYSSSTSLFWMQHRELAATARVMLIAAAARGWDVPAAQCTTNAGRVVHAASGRSADYGELAADAATVPVPDKVELKDPRHFAVIGKAVPRLDTPAKVDGSATFGLDVRLPGLRIAALVRPPAFGSRLLGFDGSDALKLNGVERVVAIDNAVAVIARDTWTALRARDLVRADWTPDPHAGRTMEQLVRTIEQRVDEPCPVARNDGEAEAALASRDARVIEARYWAPFLAHAALEPLCAVAHVRPDACDIWIGTQAQSRAQDRAAALLGLPPERVTVHSLFLGGGFGRRGEADFCLEAVAASRATGLPITVVWTHKDDIRHDYYRPAAANLLRAALTAEGKPLAYHHRIAGPSISRRRSPEALARGPDFLATEGVTDLPYDIPNLRVEYAETDVDVPVGFWRGVGFSQNGFVTECFIDELAHAAGRDPFEFRRALLDKHPRLKGVLELAAAKAGWGTKLGRGRARGIACHVSYQTPVAEVVEVTVRKGTVTVDRVVCAVDCGRVINPGIVAAQMESGIVYGLSAALHGEITLQGGQVQQSSLRNYPVLTLPEMPRIEVHIVPSTAEPTGVGEPGLPPLAPALCNALFAATGQRIRRLPIRLA